MSTAIDNIVSAGLRTTSRAKKFLGLQSSLSEVRADLIGIRAAIAQAKARLDFLKSAPLGLADTHALLCSHMERTAEHFSDALDLHTRYDPGATADRFSPSHQHPILNRAGLGPNGQTHTAIIEGFLCCMFGDAIRAGLLRELEKKDWSECGPPIAAREIEMQDLDARLAALVRDEKEIIDQLASFHIEA